MAGPKPLKYRAVVLHGAGFVGRELIRLLTLHPAVDLACVTSRSHAGEPIWKAHPSLRGYVDLTFEPEFESEDVDVVFVAAGHGHGARAVLDVLSTGYEGAIIDLSADFRLVDSKKYEDVYGAPHPAPELINRFVYGLPELFSVGSDTPYVANPGCFATGMALALHPLTAYVTPFRAAVTALTGASGSGAMASATTHFPDRDGNLRAYRVLNHRHVPEVEQALGVDGGVSFTPVSGPWTHGIWGTASAWLPDAFSGDDVSSWYARAYSEAPFVRLYPNTLPELLPAVHSPFCDIGWVVRGRELVVGFALDNLLKGAASQAIQNMNQILGLDERAGLLPSHASSDLAILPHA